MKAISPPLLESRPPKPGYLLPRPSAGLSGPPGSQLLPLVETSLGCAAAGVVSWSMALGITSSSETVLGTVSSGNGNEYRIHITGY